MIDINAPLYVLVFFITFILTVMMERYLIPFLKTRAEQPIYEDGPSWHVSKSGTPTMGGLAFLIAIIISVAISLIYMLSRGMSTEALSLGSCVIYGSLNALIGAIDDCKKLKRKQNKGLTPTQKLILQGILAAGLLAFYHFVMRGSNALSFSFGNIELGIWYYPIAFLVLLGITNCANLTDGIDGLASGVAFAIGASLFFITCALSPEVSVISSAIMGATVAFLLFNIHPAKIFMGDTGSLFLGALLASCGIALGNPLLMLILGGVYSIEGASVILQVAYYKLRKKRLFKMAPIHHHLEKIGWSENRICIVAIILTLLFAIPVYITYLP